MLKTLRNTEIKLEDGEKIDLKDFFSIYYPELTSFASRYIANLNVCEDINISHLPARLYLLELVLGYQTWVQKLIGY